MASDCASMPSLSNMTPNSLIADAREGSRIIILAGTQTPSKLLDLTKARALAKLLHRLFGLILGQRASCASNRPQVGEKITG